MALGICRLLVVECGIKFPKEGWSLGPLHWECRVLATGPPGMSQPADVSYFELDIWGFLNTVIQQILIACLLHAWQWAENEPQNWGLVLLELIVSSWEGMCLKVESESVIDKLLTDASQDYNTIPVGRVRTDFLEG